MYGRGFYGNSMLNELASDMWIDRNIPGGLDSPLGEYYDNMMGGNPNPTYGQMYNGYPGGGCYGYGGRYGYRY